MPEDTQNRNYRGCKLYCGDEPARGETFGKFTLGDTARLYMHIAAAMHGDSPDLVQDPFWLMVFWARKLAYKDKQHRDEMRGKASDEAAQKGKKLDAQALRIFDAPSILWYVDEEAKALAPPKIAANSFLSDKGSPLSSLLFAEEGLLKQGDSCAQAFIASYKTLRSSFVEMMKECESVDQDDFKSRVLADQLAAPIRNQMEAYLSDYTRLLKFLFQRDIVLQDELRDQKVFEVMMRLETQQAEDADDDVFLYSMLAPRVLDVLYRALLEAQDLPRQTIKEELTDANVQAWSSQQYLHSLACSRAADHYTNIGENLCRVAYSRRKQRIFSSPLARYSSVHDVKPIRLMEKITSHLRKYLQQIDFSNLQTTEIVNIPLKVSISGYARSRRASDPYNMLDSRQANEEIEDLISQVFSWFEDELTCVKDYSNFMTKPDGQTIEPRVRLKLTLTWWRSVTDKKLEACVAKAQADGYCKECAYNQCDKRDRCDKAHNCGICNEGCSTMVRPCPLLPKMTYVYKAGIQFDNPTKKVIGPLGTCDLSLFAAKESFFNKDFLEKAYKENDIVFLLDCPWLTTESVDALDLGSFRTFCDNVPGEYNPGNTQNFYGLGGDSESSLFASYMQQMTRLRYKNLQRAAKSVNLLKDYIMHWIQNQTNKNVKTKEDYAKQKLTTWDSAWTEEGLPDEYTFKSVYLYYSSMAGIQQSVFEGYPMIRFESYPQKQYIILHFCTLKSDLTEKKEKKPKKEEPKPPSIIISLWNFLKYIDMGFILDENDKRADVQTLKSYIVKHFAGIANLVDDKEEDPTIEERQDIITRDLFDIYRNIAFKLQYDPAKNKVIVHIVATGAVRRQLVSLSEDEKKDVKKSIEPLNRFFKLIFTEIIFKDPQPVRFSTQTIRTAFATCLFNRAESLFHLYLYHVYWERRKNTDSVNGVNVDWQGFLFPDDTTDREDEIANPPPDEETMGDGSYKNLFVDLIRCLVLPSPPYASVISVKNRVKELWSYYDYGDYGMTAQEKGDQEFQCMLKRLVRLQRDFKDACGSLKYELERISENAQAFLNRME